MTRKVWHSAVTTLMMAVAAAALTSGVSAQPPRIQTLGSFRWDGSTGSVLLQQVADGQLLVQVRILTASDTSAGRYQTRSVPTEAMDAWVLLEDGSGLVETPRQPPRGAPPPAVGNAGDEYSFVTFGFTPRATARVAAVVVRIDRQYHAFSVPAPAGADRPGQEQPAALSPPPYTAESRLISWSLSNVIQVLTLMDMGTFLKVELSSRSVSGFRGAPVGPSLDGLQVWLLRKDGTTLRQRSPIRRTAAASTAAWATHSEEVTFEPAKFEDLAAVILRAEAKLIVREMPRVIKGG
jgi:hypothetical protein